MSEEYKTASTARPLGRRIRAGVGVGGALSSELVSSRVSGGGCGTRRTWCGLGEGGTKGRVPFSSETTGRTSGSMIAVVTSERCAAPDRKSGEYTVARPPGRRFLAGVGVGGVLSSELVSSRVSGGGCGIRRTWCGFGEGGTSSSVPFSSEAASDANESPSRGLCGALKGASFDAVEWRDCGVFPGVLSCNAGRRRMRICLALGFCA